LPGQRHAALKPASLFMSWRNSGTATRQVNAAQAAGSAASHRLLAAIGGPAGPGDRCPHERDQRGLDPRALGEPADRVADLHRAEQTVCFHAGGMVLRFKSRS
jgi:hypothetical protein